jgi:pimeloyl-ACP methyl ester carboxylesterase
MATRRTSDCTTRDTRHGPVVVRDTGGDGTPVLLVHALLVDADFYRRLWPLLVERGYRCLIPELPLGSHGEPLYDDADLTPTGLADLLAEVLDGLGVDRAHVVGVDTGGALSQLLMAHHRDRVGSVVLTACDAYDAFPPKSFGFLLAWLRLPGALWATGQSARLRVARRLGNLSMLTHSGVEDATLRQWTEPLRRTAIRHDLGKVLHDMDARYTLSAAEANRDFPRPVLIAWGDDDRAFPRRLAEQLDRDLPDSRLVTLPDCAAFAALDQPELLAELIDGHITASVGARPEGPGGS